jgi:tryptophan aminotransferase
MYKVYHLYIMRVGKRTRGHAADLQTFLAVLEPGDSVLVETPLYAGAMPPLKALDANCIGELSRSPTLDEGRADPIEVDIDEGGLSPKSLEDTLANWPEGQKRPRCV